MDWGIVLNNVGGIVLTLAVIGMGFYVWAHPQNKAQKRRRDR